MSRKTPLHLQTTQWWFTKGGFFGKTKAWRTQDPKPFRMKSLSNTKSLLTFLKNSDDSRHKKTPFHFPSIVRLFGEGGSVVIGPEIGSAFLSGDAWTKIFRREQDLQRMTNVVIIVFSGDGAASEEGGWGGKRQLAGVNGKNYFGCSHRCFLSRLISALGGIKDGDWLPPPITSITLSLMSAALLEIQSTPSKRWNS